MSYIMILDKDDKLMIQKHCLDKQKVEDAIELFRLQIRELIHTIKVNDYKDICQRVNEFEDRIKNFEKELGLIIKRWGEKKNGNI